MGRPAGQKDPAALVRHLLRRVDDPRAFRRSPLFANYYVQHRDLSQHAATAKLRSMLFTAIESLRDPHCNRETWWHHNRQHTIVTRYDVAGEARETVASALGIAQSKFYYERRAALNRLADLLTDALAADYAQCSHTKTHDHDPQAFAARLRASGQFKLAIDVLQRQIDVSTNEGKRASLHCQLVGILCDANQTADAFGAFCKAQTELNEACLEPDERETLGAEVDFAGLQLSWHIGKVDEALRIGLSALDRRGNSPVFALVGGWVGSILTQKGRVREAIDVLDQAVKDVDASSDSGRSILADLLLHSANAQKVSVGNMSKARENNANALALAEEQCALNTLAQAHTNQAMIEYLSSGDVKTAIEHAAQAVKLGRASSSYSAEVEASLVLALLEGRAGQTAQALQRLADARAKSSAQSYLWIVSHAFECEALLQRHAYISALQAAKVAVESSRETSNVRTLGHSFCLLATCHAAMGDPKAAREALSDAIPLLERHGDPFTLVKALELSAALGGGRRQLQTAKEIQRALT